MLNLDGSTEKKIFYYKYFMVENLILYSVEAEVCLEDATIKGEAVCPCSCSESVFVDLCAKQEDNMSPWNKVDYEASLCSAFEHSPSVLYPILF